MRTFRIQGSRALILASGTVLCLAALGFPQKRTAEAVPTDTRFGLQLSIQIDKADLQLNDTAVLTVALKNVGESPVTIFKYLEWGGSASFISYILDSDGLVKMPTFVEDARRRPPFTKDDFMSIPPGETISRKHLLVLQTRGIDKPGTYRLGVRYRSPVWEKSAPEGLQIWAREKGELRSEEIVIQVSR